MIKPPTRAEFKKVQQQVKDALKLASTHDPDLVKWLKRIDKDVDLLVKYVRKANEMFGVDITLAAQTDHRLAVLERQMERVGAPQYRVVKKGLK